MRALTPFARYCAVLIRRQRVEVPRVPRRYRSKLTETEIADICRRDLTADGYAARYTVHRNTVIRVWRESRKRAQ